MDRTQTENHHIDRIINGAALILAAAALCRIMAVCHAGGSLYSFGIFYLAVPCGVYCIFKKALLIRESLFPVWVRALLAFFFTGSQVLGMYGSVAGAKERMHVWELFLWSACLWPLAYAAQNMLFAWVKERGLRAWKAGSGAVRRNVQEEDGFSFRKQFFAAYGVIFAGFLIPFATYYPAIMAYDVIVQLDQIRFSGYTTHHPLIHTLMLSMCLKLGEMLPMVQNADRAGLAVYTLLQMLVVAGCFAYVYAYLRKKGVHRYLCYFFALCAAFYPTHGLLAVSVTKDTIYAALVMVFTVFVWELATHESDTPVRNSYLCAYLVLTVLLLLFRNNSVYAWALFLIAACFFLRGRGREDRRLFRRICMVHGAAFALYFLLNAGMTSLSHASADTYAREMLSVPAQQIARVVAYHEEELTTQDIGRLEAVWGEGNLPEYVAAIADRSKRDIPGDRAALWTLAKEWASLGVRYPQEYVTAFLLKNKGMWYLEDSTYLFDVYSYAQGYLQITYPNDQQAYVDALVPGYERHQRLQILQTAYRYFAASYALWRYVPPLSLFMQPATYCWVLFYYCVCCIGLGKGGWLLPAVYLVALWGTLLLGPCVLVRYLYPIMLSVPVLVTLAAGRLRSEAGG